MIPCWGGGSCVPGGTTRPDRRIRSWSSSLTTTWSNSGRSWWRTASTGSLRERASTALRITTAVHKFGTDLAHPSVVWGGQWARGLGVAAAPPSRMPAERHVSQARPDKRTARRDARVAERATEEWGVLSLEELRQCGLNREAVRGRVRAGQLHRLHRAVYAVGHRAVSLECQLLAAVKSLGPDAALSHFSAAALWGFVDWDERHPEVTVCRMGARRRAGIRVPRTTGLEPRDVTRHKGILVTSPTRTLADLAGVANYKLLRTAVRRALARHRASVRQLETACRRLGPRRGSGNLRRVLATAAPTRSELEDVVFDLIVDAGFVRPDVNRPLLLAGRRVIPDSAGPSIRSWWRPTAALGTTIRSLAPTMPNARCCSRPTVIASCGSRGRRR